MPARRASDSGDAPSIAPVEEATRQPSTGDDGSDTAAGRKSQRLPYRLRAVCGRVHRLLHEFMALHRHRSRSS
jgi:hypothetical protein